MKIFIFASILVLNAYAICSKRSLNNCLKDEKCQIAQETCEIRPKNCEDINSTNPNNCGGIKCYYDYLLKSCQPFTDIISNHFRVLDHDGHENSESQDDQIRNSPYDHNQNEQNSGTPTNQGTQTNSGASTQPNTNQNQGNTNSNTNQTNNNQNPSGNDQQENNSSSNNTQTDNNTNTDDESNQTNSDQSSSNSQTNNTSTTSNSSTNSTATNTNTTTTTTTTDTDVFEIVDLKVNIEDLINKDDSTTKGIVIVSSSNLLVFLISIQFLY